MTFCTILAFCAILTCFAPFWLFVPFWLLFREQQCGPEQVRYNRTMLKLREVQKDLRRNPPEVRVTNGQELRIEIIYIG